MKPAPFDYLRPSTLAEAVQALAAHPDAKVLAGGQSLIPLLSMRLAAPPVLVDLNGLTELAYVTSDAVGVCVGALARHAQVERDAGARQVQPLVAEALRLVAHPTIRNRGTTVGSIVHADAAAEMPMVLTLLGGHVSAESVRGSRQVDAVDLFVGPLETSLAHDEIATEAFFPALASHSGVAFDEVSRRHGDYALVGAAAVVEIGDAGVVRARVGYLSVADVPQVLDLTEAFDPAHPDREDDYRAAADLAGQRIEPEADIHATADYRRHLAGVLTLRVLRNAHARAADNRAPCGRRMSEQHHDVRLRVNGATHDLTVPARRLLSDALRHDCALTGTHVGCEHGVCGACTVLLDGEPVRSCLMFAVSAQGHEITTVEGLTAANGSLGHVQQAFKQMHGLQCGFCTPGFLTTITAGLRANPEPTPDEAREMIAGNLCRCTGYQNIVASVLRAAELERDGEQP